MANFPLNDGTGSIRSSYPYTELWDLLIEKTIEVGHALTFNEAHEDPKFIDPNSYAFTLGGRFSDWAKKAWQAVESSQEGNVGRKESKEKKHQKTAKSVSTRHSKAAPEAELPPQEVPLSEVEPPSVPTVTQGTELSPADESQPKVEVINIKTPDGSVSDNGITIIELKISLPDREAPIIINLSF